VTQPTEPTTAGAPTLEAGSLEQAGAFVVVAGLILQEISGARVTGIETAASIGASTAVKERGEVAVGLTNTTHFLRSVTSGRVRVEAVALNQGRTQQLWRVDIENDSGKLVAHGEVRLQNVTASNAKPKGET
jgi:uncharacterized protein (TIGR00369 family)